MFNNTILISWNQSINEWSQQLQIYIEKTDYFGLYILGERWTEYIKELEKLQVNELVNNYDYKTFIDYIDKNEYIIFTLTKITNNIITLDITEKAKYDMSEYYKNSYDEIVQKVRNAEIKVTNIIKIISDNIIEYVQKMLKTFDSTELINIYNSMSNHGTITTKMHLYVLKYNKKVDLLEPYKWALLQIDKNKYKMEQIHPIQNINYLIKPFEVSNETKKGINISINNYSVEYNITPLISRLAASKFGPISYNSVGINNVLINRFKTINIINNSVNNLISVDSINDKLSIYTGAQFKYIEPINFVKGKKWRPSNGVDYKTYKYNEILERIIMKNMKIITLPSFKNNDYPVIVNNAVLYNGSTVSDVCYNELDKFLTKKEVTDRNIIRELYLSQYFNINKNIDYIRKQERESVDIIPVSKLLLFFKLI